MAGCRYFTYDSLRRLTQSIQPESGKTLYSYDDVGNLTQPTDARGVVTTYIYDGLNRLTQRSYAGGTPGTPAVNYTYDDAAVGNSKGRLTKVDNGISTTNYLNYDAMGQVLSSNQIQADRRMPSSAMATTWRAG